MVILDDIDIHVWRADEKAESTVEVENFDAMAGKDKERGEPQCKETSHTIANGKIEGIIRDCMLPLPIGIRAFK